MVSVARIGRRETARRIVRAGGPRRLVEWMARADVDGAAAMRDCPRADWLVWLADAGGASDAQLVRVAVAAVRAAAATVAAPAWPLGAALGCIDGEACAPRPTIVDVARSIARLEGASRRVALAVYALHKAARSPRPLAVRILAGAVALAAAAEVEARDPSLAALPAHELLRFVVGDGNNGALLPLATVAVSRALHERAGFVRQQLEAVALP